MILPPVALGLTALFGVREDVASALLLISACPIGGISNAYSYLARASTALSVTLTSLSCLCASVTIPLVRQGLELGIGRPLDFPVPVSLLFGQLLLMLALPVTVGMALRRLSPAFSEKYRPVLQRIAFIGIGVLFALIIADDFSGFVHSFSTSVPIIVAFVVLSVVVGWLTASAITQDEPDRFTIAAEFGTRNVAIALAIAVTLLGRIDFARFATMYALIEIPLLLGAVALFRGRQARAGATLPDTSALNT